MIKPPDQSASAKESEEQPEPLKLQFYERLPLQSSGVYFLIKQDAVVYIGQASNLLSRLASHQIRDYDSVGFIPAPQEMLDELEGYWISAFHPKYNLAGKIPLMDFVRPELVQQQKEIWQEAVKEWKIKYREWTDSKGRIIQRAQEYNLKFQTLLLKKGIEPHRVLEYTKRTFGWVQEPYPTTKIRHVDKNGEEVQTVATIIPAVDEDSINRQWEQWQQDDGQGLLFKKTDEPGR